MQKYEFSGHLSPRPKGTEHAMCELSGYVYLASDVESLRDSYQAAMGGIEYRDARIAELEGYLHDWLLLDWRISARLKVPHGWTDEQKHEHSVDLEARSVLKQQVRVALGKEGGK